jgi:hypothetical protein
MCTDFNDGTLQGWTYQAAWASVSSPGLDGTPFMLCEDGMEPPRSAIIGPGRFVEDWTQAEQVTLDMIVFDDGWPEESRPLFTVFQILTGPLIDQGIRAAWVLTDRITESEGDSPGWHRIVAPVHSITELPLPGNDMGYWQLREPNIDPVTEWNLLLEHVKILYITGDLIGSPYQSERFGVDNFCIHQVTP